MRDDKIINNEYKWVCVEWMDAHSCDDWQERRDVSDWAEKSIKDSNRTFGEIVIENRNYIVISASFSENKDLCGDIMMIPKCMIRRIRKYCLDEIRIKEVKK